MEKETTRKLETAQVLEVFDGDTFLINLNGKKETVRVLGIDAPETGEKYSQKECYGEEAKERAKELLAGKEVQLEGDVSQADRDKYLRLLRYVFLPDETFFNQQMIEEGLAREYTFANKKYQHQSLFRQVEKQAQEAGRGFWDKNACVEEVIEQ